MKLIRNNHLVSTSKSEYDESYKLVNDNYELKSYEELIEENYDTNIKPYPVPRYYFKEKDNFEDLKDLFVLFDSNEK